MQCPKCNEIIREGSVVCPVCYARISITASSNTVSSSNTQEIVKKGSAENKHSIETVAEYLDKYRNQYELETLRQHLLEQGCPSEIISKAISIIYSVGKTSGVQKKVFEWIFNPTGRKPEQGIALAQLNGNFVHIYVPAGLGYKRLLPTDITSIWKSIIGKFTVNGVPADKYALDFKKQYSGRFGVKFTEIPLTGGGELALFEDTPDGDINVHVASFQLQYNYERLNTGIDPRLRGYHLLHWAVFYEYALEGRYDPEHLASKLPLGRVSFTESYKHVR